jgi:two-component system response regulator AtoC
VTGYGQGYTVVVADAEGSTDRLLRQVLGGQGGTVLCAHTPEHALRVLDETAADLMVVDSGLGPSGATLLRDVQQRWPGMPVVLVADELSMAEMVTAIEAGASDLLIRPLAAAQLLFAVEKALAVMRRSASAPPPPRSEAGIVFGRSSNTEALRQLLEQVAPTASTVLVRGESGTGKELIARALHRLSARSEQPFIKIDCAALPDNLIESELFGYEKGAFTGALRQKLGRVQLADGGTLFLDEVGELALSTQSKLLRLLQDRQFERLGGTKTLHVDVRLVAATHRDLETMVERGTFRQDLFYRLNVVPLWIEPLRARREDIEQLAQHFCARAAAANGKSGIVFTPAALRLLASQRWPGNVRQLENFVERMVVLSTGGSVSEEAVAAALFRPVRFVTETGPAGADAAGGPHGDGPEDVRGVLPLDQSVRAAERQALVLALGQTGGNRSATARLLGVSRSTLYAKLRDYGIL